MRRYLLIPLVPKFLFGNALASEALLRAAGTIKHHILLILPILPILALSLIFLARTCAAEEAGVKWSGTGAFRILIDVDSAEHARVGDECPAEVGVDFERMLVEGAPGRSPDLNTLQIHAHDAKTGDPIRCFYEQQKGLTGLLPLSFCRRCLGQLRRQR